MGSSEAGETAGAPDVLDRVADAIGRLEAHADPAVRGAVRELLEGVDAVHRAGLTRLVDAITALAGEAFLNRLVADPAIRLLLMSYGLVAVDRRLQAEEAIDTVRGHLHDHGIDVELRDVVGGVVYVRLHRNGHAGDDAGLEAAAGRDVEAALRTHFLGFQELVLRDRDAAAASAAIPVEALRRAHRPVYRDVLALDALPPGAMHAVRIDDVPVLLVNVEGTVHAVRNACGESPLPLEFGALAGAELQCSWHGCRYDVRSGRRLDAEGERVQTFPVAVDGGSIRIAVGVTPAAAPR